MTEFRQATHVFIHCTEKNRLGLWSHYGEQHTNCEVTRQSSTYIFFFFSKKGLKAGLDAFLDGFIVPLSCECVGCFK